LKEAIISNNYKLQYYIYSVALYRLLGDNFEQRFGGVFYVFVRGVRKEENYGIYYDKPDIKLVKMMSEEIFK
jgi:exodeoxyribonuclease V beta subunit